LLEKQNRTADVVNTFIGNRAEQDVADFSSSGATANEKQLEPLLIGDARDNLKQVEVNRRPRDIEVEFQLRRS